MENRVKEVKRTTPIAHRPFYSMYMRAARVRSINMRRIQAEFMRQRFEA